MKRNWEKDLHDRLGNYEQDAPDGLWEEISRQMADAKQRPGRDRKPALFLTLPMRRAVSVAAAACLALAVGYYFYGNDTDGTGNTDYTAETVATPSAPSPKQDSTSPAAESSRSAEQSIVPITPTTPITPITPTTPPAPAPEENHRQTEQQQQQQQQQQKPAQETNNRHLMAYAENNHQSRRKGNSASRWSIGTNATAGMGTSQTARGNGVPLVASSSVEADDVFFPQLGNPQLGVYNNSYYSQYLYNRQVPNPKTEYTHHLPVRFGLNVAYRLTDRLSIESGLSYTQLSSDLKDGTEESYSTGTQELDYVGIPVNLKYRVLGRRHFRLYASAGVLAEQCVSGKVTQKTVLGETTAKTEEARVATKPQQLSVNAAVGVQFDLSGNVGIYAEPGLSYYFDDRSSLSTIYKEKPLNFNLNVGLRFTVGK